MPMFMTHIKYETGSLQALFNGQQFVWVFYDAVGPWRPKNRTSLAPKAHTCSSPDDHGGDDAADDADEDRLPRAVSDGHWPK